jgi:Methane/Phenol/Toluene Hydroxylase
LPPRTFEHLQGKRRPNVYDEVTSHVQWGEPFRGKFPDLPSEGAHYHFPEHYKLGYWDPGKTAWTSDDWEAYRDPSQLTYRSYHEIQYPRENALTAILDAARESRALTDVDDAWVQALREFFGALRFPEWGVSMACQYVSRFAITASITNCGLLQSFDELRHTQRIAEWTRDLETVHGGFGEYRKQWMEAELFQPLREYLERVCVARDWGEVVLATNIVLEPLLQPVLHALLSDVGQAHKDAVLPHFSYSLMLDEQRHWAWGRALARMLHSDERNVERTQEWIQVWHPRAEAAVAAFGPVFDKLDARATFDTALEGAKEDVRASFAELTVLAPAESAA